MVHSSLRNFGRVKNGADSIIEAICESVETCMMPAFSFCSVVAPPILDRPVRNGIDYETFRTLIIPTPPFKIEEAPLDSKMGVVAKKFSQIEGCLRSDHPWLSYSAWGEGNKELTDPHP